MCSTGRKPVQANHLRVLLLVINLTLGATLPFVYAWSMSSASVTVSGKGVHQCFPCQIRS